MARPGDAEDRDEPAQPVDEHHMSDVEALMWTLEKDPRLSSTFANLTLFDRVPDVDRLVDRLEEATRHVPRLRQRVIASFGRLAPPEWSDDPDFDVRHHVRRIDLPPPGHLDQLQALAAQLATDPFDRARPLWEFVVIGGLADGGGAMVQRMHHTITDGEGGVRLSVQFIDFERDPEPAQHPGGGTADAAAEPVADARDRTLVDGLSSALGHVARRQLGIARRSATIAVDTAVHPTRLLHLPGDAVGTAQAITRQGLMTDRAHSPLWTERSLRRHLEVLSVPLAEVKHAATALGGSVNDLFVCAAAGAAGAYHRARGVEVDELRMAMPVSTRHDRSVGGNAFTPSRVLVPVGADPAARFAEVHERLDRVKSDPALNVVQNMAGLVNLLPTSVLVRMARRQVETVDFTTSNVRGAPFDLYIAGGHILHNHPVGPLAGTAFNLTTLSYRGNLDMGLVVDTAAIDEPAELRAHLEDAFAELLALA